MQKRLSVAALLVLLVAVLAGAQAPELQAVAPHSWEELTRIPQGAAGRALVADCLAALKRSPSLVRNDAALPWEPQAYDLYVQRVAGVDFYRLIFSRSEGIAALSKRNAFFITEGEYSSGAFARLRSNDDMLLEYLFTPGDGGMIFLGYGEFAKWGESNQDGIFVDYSDFLLIPRNEKTESVGVLVLHARVFLEQGQTRGGKTRLRFKTVHVQPTARQSATYTLLEAPALWKADAHDVPSEAVCAITASDFLFDKTVPLRYSLLSAFDGDARTCYKESAAENTITLGFTFFADAPALARAKPVRLTQAAAINGDAQDRDVYMRTNRIATFAVSASGDSGANVPFTENCSVSLSDYQLDMQTMYLPFSAEKTQYEFVTASVFKGIPYDDTCLAEFNLHLAQLGWLFQRMP